ncbi:MAG: hypothetical protein PHY08_11775 [Candidatus Cloacimonetes bacterium]|nr:hypothetical protein [Candidatus Cloacimonadota bacterium]MDD4157240.1 hypothetical protein [Candidatus Cloacimonadota bacterium]
MKMNLFLIFISLIININCITYNSDSEDEKEAKMQLAAIIQYSAPYRFGQNLSLGDKVIYNTNDENIVLEVISKNDSLFTIKEEFYGNILIITYNYKNKNVTQIEGYKPNGDNVNLELCDNLILEEKIQMIKNNIKFINEIRGVENMKSMHNINIKNQNLNCQNYVTKFNENKFNSKEEIDAINSVYNLYISNDIPKLYPSIDFLYYSLYTGNPLKDNSGGLVKSGTMNLINFIKK